MSISTAQAFLDAAKKRRTIYAIKDTDLPINESEIESIVTQALIDSPSAWNVCSSRAIIVLNDQHKRLFNDVIHTTLMSTMPPERQEWITNRIQGFAAGAGSVLIFEDQEALEELGKQQPHAAFAIPEYSEIATGMFQYAVWTAFSVAGLGCSLQHLHFQPGVDEAIRKAYDIPEKWKMYAQLVFGRSTKEPGDRTWPPSAPIEERIRVLAQL